MTKDSNLDPVAERRLREFLLGAVNEQEDAEPVPDVLIGVQEKLRIRSGGKFYDDAWSTSRSAPVSRYLITSLIMLTVMALAYFTLRPLAGRPEPVRNEPKAIEVIAPQRVK